MPHRDIIVIGTSAGGVETLPKLFAPIPKSFPAAFFVVLHVQANTPSLLPHLLNRTNELTALHPRNNERIRHGHIYIAPPDHHLLIEPNRMRLSHGPRENRHRPAIDPLFRTAARTYGPRVIGLILTGTLDDGSVGLLEVKKQNGLTIVQQPEDAMYADMPRNAMAACNPDFCAPLSRIPELLNQAVHTIVDKKGVKAAKDRGMRPESKRIKSATEVKRSLGSPSGFVCPECNGPLWNITNGRSELFRCLVGHSYASENLFAAQSEAVERSLWVALRALEERVELQRNLAERARRAKQLHVSRQFLARSRENSQHANLIRKVLDQL